MALDLNCRCRLRARTAQPPVLAILVPFSLEQGPPDDLPSYFEAPSTSGPRIVLSTIYTRLSPKAVDTVRWALDKGFTIDIDIETNLRAGEGAWEDLEELLTKAIPASPKGKVVLCTSRFALHDNPWLIGAFR